jgi:hypothetical protein
LFELGGRHRCAGQSNKLDLCGVLSTRRRQFIIDEDDECWAGEQLWKLHMRVTSIRAELASLRGKVRVGLFLCFFVSNFV